MNGNYCSNAINLRCRDGLSLVSAYESAVKNGYEGTEMEWLSSLKERSSDLVIIDNSITELDFTDGNDKFIYCDLDKLKYYDSESDQEYINVYTSNDENTLILIDPLNTDNSKDFWLYDYANFPIITTEDNKVDYASITQQGYTSCVISGNGITEFDISEYSEFYENISYLYSEYLDSTTTYDYFTENIRIKTKLLFQEFLADKDMIIYDDSQSSKIDSIVSIFHLLDQMSIEDTVKYLNYLRAENESLDNPITDEVFVPIIESCILEDGFLYLKGAIYEWDDENETYSFKEIVAQAINSQYGIEGVSMVWCVVFRAPGYFKSVTLNFGEKDFNSGNRYLIYFNNIGSNNNAGLLFKSNDENVRFLELLESTSTTIDDSTETHVFTPNYASEQLYELYMTPNYLSADGSIKLVNIEKKNQISPDDYYGTDDSYIQLSYSTSYSEYANSLLVYADYDYTDISEVTTIVNDNIEYTVLNSLNSVCVLGTDTDITTLSIPAEFVIDEITYQVTQINANAFYGNEYLTTVTLPNSLSYIGNAAFSECSNLASVTVNWETPLELSSDVFQNISESATLYVPGDSVSLYEADYYWGQFNNIVEE